MSKLETIPAEEGATLLPKPKSTGIRRVVAVSAMVSFVIGVLAATAVRTSPVRHASNLHSKHEHETTEVDDEGPHPYYWDDDVPTQRRTSRPGVARNQAYLVMHTGFPGRRNRDGGLRAEVHHRRGLRHAVAGVQRVRRVSELGRRPGHGVRRHTAARPARNDQERAHQPRARPASLPRRVASNRRGWSWRNL